MVLDTAREARIAHRDSEASSMDNKLYELEVERTRNLGNMTSALLMLASSMDTLTRSYVQTQTIQAFFVRCLMVFADVLQCVLNSVCAQGSLEDLPVPSCLPTMPFPHSQVPWALEVESRHRPPCVKCHPHPMEIGGTPLVSGLVCGLCLPTGCCAARNKNVRLWA